MSKRYVVNPKTNRAVDVEGCAGLKIINQLLKKGIQVKYQSTKSKSNTCKDGEKRVVRKINGEKKSVCVDKTTLRTKCPKGEINYKGDCIKKQNKPKGTRGGPKKNKPVVVEKDVYMKVKKEIQNYYKSITNLWLQESDMGAGSFGSPFSSNLYFNQDDDDLSMMPTFIQLSGRHQWEIEESCHKLFKKLVKTDKHGFVLDHQIDPLEFNKIVFGKIIDHKSFINDPAVKDKLKILVNNLGEKIEAKFENY
jgi:hypothetical protein